MKNKKEICEKNKPKCHNSKSSLFCSGKRSRTKQLKPKCKYCNYCRDNCGSYYIARLNKLRGM